MPNVCKWSDIEVKFTQIFPPHDIILPNEIRSSRFEAKDAVRNLPVRPELSSLGSLILIDCYLMMYFSNIVDMIYLL